MSRNMDLTFSCVKDLENLSFSLSSTMGTLYNVTIANYKLVSAVKGNKDDTKDSKWINVDNFLQLLYITLW